MEYEYFVDGKSHKTTLKCITGMYLRMNTMGFDNGYQILLQQKGLPDTLFIDQSTFDLSIDKAIFYTFPKASFGG